MKGVLFGLALLLTLATPVIAQTEKPTVETHTLDFRTDGQCIQKEGKQDLPIKVSQV